MSFCEKHTRVKTLKILWELKKLIKLYVISVGNLSTLQSQEKAIEYFRLAAKQGFAKAQKFLNENEDLNEIKKRANQGDATAQMQMGVLYQQGKRLQKSLIEACKYYKLAAHTFNFSWQNPSIEWDMQWKGHWKMLFIIINLQPIKVILNLFACYSTLITMDKTLNNLTKKLSNTSN